MYNHFVFQRLVGSSHWTERIRRRIVQISHFSYPVLIQGAAGAGKELLARAIHAHSCRAAGPFIPFRTAQLPPEFAAAQLFGQAAGVSRLARFATLGCVRAAQGGTLYIEEVGDLDAAGQQRLLEVLKAKQTTRVGEELPVAVDIRLVCSTSRDLLQEAREGRFSLELLYRLSAISIQVASLQERPEDVQVIANHLLARITFEAGMPLRQLSPAAMALLQTYDWPENIDELEEVLEQALFQTDRDVLELEDFPDLLEAVQRLVDETQTATTTESAAAEPVNGFESVAPSTGVSGEWRSLQAVEAEHIRATLRECDDNLAIAAKLLGIDVPQLTERMNRCGVRVPLPRWSLPDNLS